MEIKILKNKINSYLHKTQNKKIVTTPEKRRLQTINLTKILKNKIFKGYEKIKLLQNKNFDINQFINNKPEENYLLTDEKYNIYYSNKYLNKYKPISKRDSFLLKSISIENKNIPKKLKNSKCKSELELTKIKKLKIKYNSRQRGELLKEKNKNKYNINDSSKVFDDKMQNQLFSKYPLIYLEKQYDEIMTPTDMKNYPHYIPKYKDKNRKQEYFLHNLSHSKEKIVKNIYHSLTPRISIKKRKQKKYIDKNENKNFVLSSFSPQDNQDYNFVNIINNNRLKKLLIQKLFSISSEKI